VVSMLPGEGGAQHAVVGSFTVQNNALVLWLLCLCCTETVHLSFIVNHS
jgi:hypothetical protein